MKRSKSLTAAALGILGLGAAGICSAGAPVSWGPTTGAKGCIILRESEKLDVKTSANGAGTIVNSSFELSIVTANGYALARDTWPDNQATLDEFQRIAVTEQTRFVKVRDPYTPQDIEAAQSMCRQSMEAV